MNKHPSALVQDTAEVVGDYMDLIMQLFKPGMKITVIIRNPDKPDFSQDFVQSNDDLKLAATALLARIDPNVLSLKGRV